MKKRIVYKSIPVLLAVLTLASSLSGCGKNEEEAPTGNLYAPVTEESKNDGTSQDYGTSAAPDKMFTLRFTSDETLNPLYCDGVYNSGVTSLMYEGLFRLTNNFETENVLCENYETADGTVFYFDLIDAKMHDGTSLTAEDAAYSINLARNSNKYGSRLRKISYCGVTESGRLEVDLTEADRSLPEILDIPIIKSGTGDSDVPPGTGPYTYVKAGFFSVLIAFKNYRSYESLPIDRIYLKEFTDDNIVESFADYSLDLIWEDPSGDSAVNLHSDHEARLYDTAILQYIGFNSASAPMNDPNMRKAVSCAVNRDYIVNDIYGGTGRAAPLILNPAHYLYNTNWEAGYGYSPSMMSTYLASSALADNNNDGFLEYPVNGVYEPFTIRFIVNSGNEKKLAAATRIADNLRRIGIDVELTELSWANYTRALKSGEFDMYYGEVSMTKNFDFSVLIGSGGDMDFGGMGSESYNTLINAFLNAGSDENKRSAAMGLCVIAAENAVIVPIIYRQYAIYSHRGVIENFNPSVSGVFSDVSGWTLNMPE